jgi:DnaJ-class molecular chaperone
LFVEVSVTIPKRVSSRQAELIKEFMEEDEKERSAEPSVRKWPWKKRSRPQEAKASGGAASRQHS